MATFETIKLDKWLYEGKGFLANLEEIDPSENYKGTELEDLDAFERQLKRYDIKVSGANSDMVGKFFDTTDSAVLFPEYVSRAVRQGIEENSKVLNDIIATKTNISSYDYRTISVSQPNNTLAVTPAKGELIPETVVQTQDSLVPLKKHGRMLVASYEAIRFQRLPILTITLRQIGKSIVDAQFKDAVHTLLDGATEHNTMSLPVLNNFLSPYNLNTIIMNQYAVTSSTLNIVPDFLSDPRAVNINFIPTDKIETKLLIGFDKTCALEMVTAGGVQTNYHGLIDRKFERSSITQTAGFSKIFADAVKVMKL